jgi:RNA polymerase sigma factor (sigma-70 family)
MSSLSAVMPIRSKAQELDFDTLYRTHRHGVYAYVVSIVGNAHIAEDVVAAAFEKAWRRRRTYRLSRGSERAWLFTIARTAALDELRRARKRPLPSDQLPDQPQPDQSQAIANTEYVNGLLQTLTDSERELIALRYWADLTNADIAAITGLSETNVATKLSRILTRLRKENDHD